MTGKKAPPFWEKDLGIWDASHVVGLRSHYVASVFVAKKMVEDQIGGLIVNVSSGGGLEYLFDVAYGVGKAALDRLTADTAVELQKHNVAVVSLWPGAVSTEKVKEVLLDQRELHPKLKVMFGDAETPEFSGRAVVALASDPDVMAFTGHVLTVVELARYYNFTDTDGKVHGESFSKFLRSEMQKPPKQWRKPSKL
eukprot:TRINITY_DN8576_c0_g1_i10.p1 TRINITY_DN8576_c0_g1~~TRINITY_DN8576_c0_g1_i10.p1  ORF type:complete len:196 (-),score=52.97 TRINITY_DN8576_c0_g1_i10:123-710(-)